MSKRFMDPKSKILIALNFDEQAPRLLELAKKISERTGLGIRLVHVIEPTLREVYPGTLDITGAIRDAAEEIDEANTREARERLFQYERDYFQGSPQKSPTESGRGTVERTVLMGMTADAIIAEATLNNAALILCGAGSKHSHYVPVGFSTALSLMTGAPCPVMVQGINCTHDLKGSRMKLMIADDLSPAGLDAVMTGLDMARALGRTDVLHMTVGPTSQNWFLALKGRLTSQDKDKSQAQIDAHELLTGVTAKLDTKLRERAPEHVALLPTRESNYKTLVVHGRDTAEEVARASKDFGADIVVYGRHRAFHREPWALGKIAWHEMMAGERLLLVAPPQ